MQTVGTIHDQELVARGEKLRRVHGPAYFQIYFKAFIPAKIEAPLCL